MDPLYYEAVTRNPELIESLLAQARRERAEAVHRLLVAPIKSLFRHHAARSHLGHSGKVGDAAA